MYILYIYIKIFVKIFVSTNRIRNGKYEYSNLHLTESDEILIYIYSGAPQIQAASPPMTATST